MNMTQREGDAIRMLITAMRSDKATVAKVLAFMRREGFTAEETQAAVNTVSEEFV